jgi:hypothetical protein
MKSRQRLNHRAVSATGENTYGLTTSVVEISGAVVETPFLRLVSTTNKHRCRRNMLKTTWLGYIDECKFMMF